MRPLKINPNSYMVNKIMNGVGWLRVGGGWVRTRVADGEVWVPTGSF